ncbi:MAG: hypothetical protein LBU14_02615 [Candidatus Peribacteria bacterium]|jgi:hypothetical protein|nr:hypothetical protein [Candidatus Peribacteria bacterium]
MKHCKSYKKRKDLLLNKVNPDFWKYFKLDSDFTKVSYKNRRRFNTINLWDICSDPTLTLPLARGGECSSPPLYNGRKM